MPELVTLGETCAVLIAKSGGPLRHASEFERRVGGAESTVAVGVARLGGSAGWISRLGDDEFGTYVLNLMRGEDVDVRHVNVAAGEQTGVFFRENRANGNSQVFYYRSSSAFTSISPSDLDEAYIKSANILHLTGITPSLSQSCLETVERAIEIARAGETDIVFDLNYRAKIWPRDLARPHLERIMKKADIVLAGREDIYKLVGATEQNDQLSYLKELDLPTIILKSGSGGTILADANGEHCISSVSINQVVDRFGVGDAFAAGYITGLLRKQSQKDAVALGNEVAGWSIQLPGNIESLPNWNDLNSSKSKLTVAGR